MNKCFFTLSCLLLLTTHVHAQGLQLGGGFAAAIPVGLSNNALTPGIGLDASLHYRFADQGLGVGLVSGFYRFWPDSTVAYDVSYVPLQAEVNYFGGSGKAKFYIGMRAGMARYYERTRNPGLVKQSETRKFWFGTLSPQVGLEYPLMDKLALDIRLAYAILFNRDTSADFNLQHFTVGAGVRYSMFE